MDKFKDPDWLGEESQISFSDSARIAINTGRLRFRVNNQGPLAHIHRVKIHVEALSGNIIISPC